MERVDNGVGGESCSPRIGTRWEMGGWSGVGLGERRGNMVTGVGGRGGTNPDHHAVRGVLCSKGQQEGGISGGLGLEGCHVLQP